MKSPVEGLNIRFDQAEEITVELGDRSIEIIQYKEKKEKRMEKNEQKLRDLWDTINHTNIN